MRYFLLLAISFVSILIITNAVYAQRVLKDSVPIITKEEKKFTLGTLLVADYMRVLTPDVDMSGKHHPDGTNTVDGFFLRYARVSGNYVLNNSLSAGILVNLADFKSDTKGKVLENAFIRYKINNYAAFTVGQFRPYFGLEDMYPFDFNKSYYWSNQYSLFGANGWQSFQLGVAANGSLADIKIPFNYYVSVVNGNGKNQAGDNDRNKDVMVRADYTFFKKLKLGANIGFSRYDEQPADAYGIDMQLDVPVNDKWQMAIEAEYKNGTNFNAYAADTAKDKRLSGYRMGGYYITPMAHFNINKPKIKSIEASVRYENLETLLSANNPRCTTTPMLAVNFAEKYAARLCIGLTIDKYKKQEAGTSSWNSNQFFTQVQFRF